MKSGITKIGFTRSKMPVKIGLIALTLASSQIVAAAEAGWYIGAGIGQPTADIDYNGLRAARLAEGFNLNRLTSDNSDTAVKVFGGYQFNDYLSVEGGYFDLGEFGYRATANQPTGLYTGDMKVRGLNLDLVGTLPLNDRLSAFARAGGILNENKSTFRGSGSAMVAPFGDKDRDEGHKYGAGLQYDFSTNIAMRVEAERYDVDSSMLRDSNVDVYSASILYRFGAAAPAPVRTPVSAAPAPQPQAAPTPPPAPEPVRVTLSADALFAFDSATLTAAGRAELDELIGDLRNVEYDTVLVIGHTDRIGTAEYNQDLSVRRANSVRDYLVASGGIPQSRISARGVGSTQPVTNATVCPRQQERDALIACLQPDRRVEVEVSGTRPR